MGHGRAHIEIKGALDGTHGPERVEFVRTLEQEFARLEGVRSAWVAEELGRVIVAFDAEHVGLDDLVEVIEGAEELHGLSGERFPQQSAEYPGDVEPSIRRQVCAMTADVAGLGLGLGRRAIGANRLVEGLASVLTLVDATPVLRRRLEDRLGGPLTDLGLALGNAAAQGLAQGPFGLIVDFSHRALLLQELRARRAVWARREPELFGCPARGGSGPEQVESSTEQAGAARTARPTDLPAGPVETYTARASLAALGAASAALVVGRDPALMMAAAVAGTPKAAGTGRSAFSARLGRDLARSGVLALRPQALHLLDRVDTVVLDAELLTTGRTVVGSVWVRPDIPGGLGEDRLRLVARSLLNRDLNRDLNGDDGPPPDQEDSWTLSPARRLGGPALRAARDLRGGGRRVLALHHDHRLVALVAAEPELDPLAGAVVTAARAVGPVVVAGRHDGLGELVRADRSVPGGTRTAASVRALQADGRVVALVSSRHHRALSAADVGIGVPTGGHFLSGAHLLTTPSGLADACRILQAIPAARAVSRRVVRLAAYGAGAGCVLALAGPRAGATRRALLAVNGAAAAGLAVGTWTAADLARRRAPLPADGGDWHAMPPDAVLERLDTRLEGLEASEAERRRKRAPGPRAEQEPGVVQASLQELANPLTPALASGAGLSAAAGALTDAALIGGVMAANAVIGGLQRVGAERSLRRLVGASATRVLLRRSCAEAPTTTEHLVVGDIIVVHAGDAVPADCRVLESHGLEVDESALTGESQLVTKTSEPTAARSVADRRSMLYAGTTVATGSGTGVVVALGPATELGRSAESAQEPRRPGGVEARLRQLTKVTVPISLGAGAAVIVGGLLRGRRLADSLGTGVSLAVAAVPEGLPLIATIAQLGAARRLSRRNALVRTPSTIETLGRVDVLCFDKTGTLTEGRIRLNRVAVPGIGVVDAADSRARPTLAAALRASPRHAAGEPLPHPTDRAVVDGAAAAGVPVGLGPGQWSMEAELPFEPSRGYHAVLGRGATGRMLSVKGAPEIVLPRCTQVVGPDGPTVLDDGARHALDVEVERLARHGYRVLAVAERDASGGPDLDDDRIERLQVRGLLALSDPVRASAAQAVTGLRAAGVDVLMLTGDHPSTAEAIAAELELLNGQPVVTGPQVQTLAEDELAELVRKAAVFARVSPDHKVRIVSALQHAGRVVAVTGDGANDAAAIRLADVGVALGLRGTDAAKQAADVVVTDDRIETLIDAIVEGRAMWSSVRDAIAVLLGGNLGEIAFTLGTGLLSPTGSALNGRQLLLVNLLTDLLPSMALAVRPPTTTTPERLLHEGPDASLAASLDRDILVRAALTSGAGMAAWLGGRMTGVTTRHAGTVALIGLIGAQLGQTLVIGWRDPLTVAAIGVSAAALVGIVQTPGISHFFGCQPLGPVGWAIGLGASAAAGLAAPLLPHLLPHIS